MYDWGRLAAVVLLTLIKYLGVAAAVFIPSLLAPGFVLPTAAGLVLVLIITVTGLILDIWAPPAMGSMRSIPVDMVVAPAIIWAWAALYPATQASLSGLLLVSLLIGVVEFFVHLTMPLRWNT